MFVLFYVVAVCCIATVKMFYLGVQRMLPSALEFNYSHVKSNERDVVLPAVASQVIMS